MLIIFNVNGQKVTHDIENNQIVGGSSGVVQAAFTFDKSWREYEVVVVFSNSNQPRRTIQPLKYEGEAISIPEEALVPGKLYVSVIGFGLNKTRKTTQKWDIQQAITVQEFGELGDCELLRSLAHDGDKLVDEDDIAKNEQVEEMLDRVFGGTEDPGNSDNNDEDFTPSIPETKVASNAEIEDMLDRIFGPKDTE